MFFKKNLFLLIGLFICGLMSTYVYGGTAIKINHTTVDLDSKTIKFYGINLNAFGTPTVTIGDTVLNGCIVEAGSIECSIDNTPAISGGTWRVRVSAGNSPNTNDQIDVFISVGVAPTLCTPGDLVQCYSGPPETRNVGTCIGGVRTCLSDGTWSNCQGEILPQQEICGDNKDNNCDGQVDEGCLPCGVDQCFINGICYNNGDLQPGNDCGICYSSRPFEWQNQIDGYPCRAVPGGTCRMGFCAQW